MHLYELNIQYPLILHLLFEFVYRLPHGMKNKLGRLKSRSNFVSIVQTLGEAIVKMYVKSRRRLNGCVQCNKPKY